GSARSQSMTAYRSDANRTGWPVPWLIRAAAASPGSPPALWDRHASAIDWWKLAKQVGRQRVGKSLADFIEAPGPLYFLARGGVEAVGVDQTTSWQPCDRR